MSMIMQNVKELEIPEGDVRTIQDHDGKLLWGRLAYNTKYAGDTYQQTYSGKNLIAGSYDKISQTARCTVASQGNGFTITSTSSSGATYVTIPIPNITELLGKTVTLSYTATGDGINARFYYINSSGTATNGIGNGPTITLPNSLGDNYGIGITFYTSNGGSATYNDIQLEEASSATSFEPYTGGIPAPNPDYPQDIQVVTGEQTVTISDGVDSEDFTISLGSLELCKIGDYQDYIYKSVDDWYVHKGIGKATLTGSEDWQTNAKKLFFLNTAFDNCFLADIQGSTGKTRCDYYTDRGIPLWQDSSFTIQNGYLVNQGKPFIRNLDIDTTANFQTWLSAHNITVYYPLATPTDTKITDATLVGQLNAVHEWLTRYGYTSTVTGELPIIIEQTNL